MSRVTKWMQIYEIIRDRITNEEYAPGSELPTNLELMKEFEAHSGTIQNAINTLIRDGLIFSSGSNPNRRRVRPILYRSSRKGDFLEEHGDLGLEKVVDIRIIYEDEELPTSLQDEFTAPVLFYQTRQYRDDILVATTYSYIPNVVDLKVLRGMLKEKGAMIYDCLKQLGVDPAECEEKLIASLPSESDREKLDLPQHANIPVVHIERRAFDPNGKCVQVCYMIDRADCYEFTYKFPLF
ncbi:GntR family transcriptional regulator [Thermoactinomyces sp. DSM 45892]|uniref:GntR family transcriptional regulator n=1 Tax=Thermoactinomyces sp. DSM 45892 TaxID=1882753 RepID=UPI00089A20ED|nr:GntR family transcriptional regulator [Thermoactinomyces sp. DSM 45892]SDZ38726.1 transcriptional regulator, GntR family [Thermoactinomyces sp. DSM 45892]